MTRLTPKQLKQLLEKQSKQKTKKAPKKSNFSVSEFNQSFFKKSESQEQDELCQWIKDNYPDILYNTDLAGISLTPVQRKAYSQRKKRGHPDLIIYEWYKDKFCGLAIEFKRTGEKIKLDEHQKEQLDFINDLRERQWLSCFVIGLHNAKKVISLYLEGADLERINYFIYPKIQTS